MKHITAFVLATALLLLTACGGGAPESTNIIPDDDFSMMITMKPASIWNSELISNFRDELDEEIAEVLMQSLVDWGLILRITRALDAEVTEVESITMLTEITPSNDYRIMRTGNFLIMASGESIDEDTLEDGVKLIFQQHPEWDDDEIGSYEIFTTEAEHYEGHKFSYSFAKETAIFGFEDNVENSLKVIDGSGEPISKNKEFNEISGLIRNDAHYTILLWNVEEILEVAQESLSEFIDIDQEYAQRYGNPFPASSFIPLDAELVLEEAVAGGFSIKFDSGLTFDLRIRFESEEAAEEMIHMFEDVSMMMKTTTMAHWIKAVAGLSAETTKIRDVLRRITVNRDGTTTVFSWNIPGNSALLNVEEIAERINDTLGDQISEYLRYQQYYRDAMEEQNSDAAADETNEGYDYAGEAASEEPGDNSSVEYRGDSFEAVVAKYGEPKVKEIYIDVQANAEAGFLSDVLGDISTEELMEMSAEERQEYAVQQGKKKGREVAKRISKACNANGITMQEWRVISAYANENGWREQMNELLNARKNELKAEMETGEYTN